MSKGLAFPSLLSTYNSERLPVVKEMLNISTKLHKDAANAGRAILTNPSGSTKGTSLERDNKTKQLTLNYRWSDIVFDERVQKVTDSESGETKIWTPYGAEGDIVHPGDRAPDAPVFITSSAGASELTTLFGLLRPTRHTVFIFPSSSSAADLSTAKALFLQLASYNNKEATTPESLVKPYVILPSSPSVPSDLEESVLIDTNGHARKGYGIDLEGNKEMVAVIIRPDSFVGAFVKTEEGIDTYFSKIFL